MGLMTDQVKWWIFIGCECVAGAGFIWGTICWARRHRKIMSERIYYSKHMPAGERSLTIYPLKLTEEQQEELAIIEKRLMELADSAEERMSIKLKEDGRASE
jgi:hypothetical protein